MDGEDIFSDIRVRSEMTYNLCEMMRCRQYVCSFSAHIYIVRCSFSAKSGDSLMREKAKQKCPMRVDD
jgi:hypothetical protein